MTETVGTQTLTWLDQFAQTGSPWALISVLIVAFGIIGYVLYKAYCDSKKESHEQHLALMERARQMQDEQRLDNLQREQEWKVERSLMMEQLSRMNDSLATLSNGYTVFATTLDKNTEDIRDIRNEVKDVKNVMMMKKD